MSYKISYVNIYQTLLIPITITTRTDEAYVEAPQPTPSGGGSSMSSTNLMAILIPVVLVVVALSAALVFFIVRHKRLQRSFLAFANSHYNIQSGTTTFSDDLGKCASVSNAKKKILCIHVVNIVVKRGQKKILLFSNLFPLQNSHQLSALLFH